MQNTCKNSRLDSSGQPLLKRIAICADDFGMDSSVDRGILALTRLGRLSAVSCMTQGPSLRANASALAELPTDIGLHLNFTEPFRGVEFHLPLAHLIVASYLRLLPRSQIIEQIHRQLDAFESCFQRPPNFIDGHQHVHQLPVIRDSLLTIIGQRYPAQSLWLRSTRPAEVSAGGQLARLKPHIIALLGARKLCVLATAAGWPMNHHLLGVYDFSASTEAYADLLVGWLSDAEEGDLLMCHPANTAEPAVAFGPQRTREYSVIADPGFGRWLDQAGLTVSRLSQFAKD